MGRLDADIVDVGACLLASGTVLAEKNMFAWPPVMASAGVRAYQGGLGALLPAEVPPMGGQVANPPEADDILTVKHSIFRLNCTSNRTFLKAKTGSTVHKNIPQNGIRQRASQRIAQVAIIWDIVLDVTGLPVSRWLTARLGQWPQVQV